MGEDGVNPRTEADAQIARALRIVCDADCVEGCDQEPCPHERRDYTPEELGELFFALGMAMCQLTKLPGGPEAKDKHYAELKAELKRRGRDDLIKSAETT